MTTTLKRIKTIHIQLKKGSYCLYPPSISNCQHMLCYKLQSLYFQAFLRNKIVSYKLPRFPITELLNISKGQKWST